MRARHRLNWQTQRAQQRRSRLITENVSFVHVEFANLPKLLPIKYAGVLGANELPGRNCLMLTSCPSSDDRVVCRNFEMA